MSLYKISIHTFLAEGDVQYGFRLMLQTISIHTFLAEGDNVLKSLSRIFLISIHTFLAEGDSISSIVSDLSMSFQSTPSLRKVTAYVTRSSSLFDISIHTFLAEGDVGEGVSSPIINISIHTFLAEGDNSKRVNIHHDSQFQSTPSLRKVTAKISIIKFLLYIFLCIIFYPTYRFCFFSSL